jgi:hypothetical protein
LDTSKQVQIHFSHLSLDRDERIEKMSRALIGKTELISVLYYLYKMNRDPMTGKINPFKRCFVSEMDLLRVVKEIDPEFYAPTFKIWADQGFLLSRGTGEYSYLIAAVLMKIFSVEGNRVSLVESVALQHLLGNLSKLFESIFAEGIECNILNKQLRGIYSLQRLNMEDLSLDFIINHVNIVYRIRLDHFGSGKNILVSHEISSIGQRTREHIVFTGYY